jgi:CheY-like chemotaxis protein
MPNGGTIYLWTSTSYLDSGYLERQPMVVAGPYVRLSVRDTGMGMTESTMAHIFEPFFTTKPMGKGTGLGLATSYGIVKQSRGYIDVDSTPGKGSRFDIYLPQVVRKATAEDALKAPTIARGVEAILLVEDNQALRAMAKTLLETYGYTVHAIADPDEVEAVCDHAQNEISLLLTDIVLPRMSGAEVARRVSAKIPTVKILYMSGFPSHSTFDPSLLEESAPFLQKPFAPSVLAAKVREILDQRPSSSN